MVPPVDMAAHLYHHQAGHGRHAFSPVPQHTETFSAVFDLRVRSDRPGGCVRVSVGRRAERRPGTDPYPHPTHVTPSQVAANRSCSSAMFSGSLWAARDRYHDIPLARVASVRNAKHEQ